MNCFGIKVQPLVCIETQKWKQISRTAGPSRVLGNSIAGSSIGFYLGAAGSALELSVHLTSRDMGLLRHELLALIEVSGATCLNFVLVCVCTCTHHNVWLSHCLDCFQEAHGILRWFPWKSQGHYLALGYSGLRLHAQRESHVSEGISCVTYICLHVYIDVLINPEGQLI